MKDTAPKFPVPSSRIAADVLLGEIANTTAELKAKRAAMDSALTAVRVEHEPVITELLGKLDGQSGSLETWAWQAQKTEFPEDKRSIDMINGRVYFRLGKPKLATLARFTWDKVLDKIRALRPEYVRTKEEVDKEKILSDIKSDFINAGGLSAVGVKCVQDDSFGYELKS